MTIISDHGCSKKGLPTKLITYKYFKMRL